MAMAQQLGVPEIVGRVLDGRAVGLEDASRFLDPTLRDLLPDPGHLLGMETAAERLASAVMQGERIAVFGDYDVDGATSSALLKRYFEALGASLRVYIPDRLAEGYGPNTQALLRLKDEGASVVITVDCGTTAHEPLQAAREAGLDVIVVDHHEAEADLPAALAVVNPNRLDETSPHGHMAAVGVAFLLCVAVNRTLRGAGFFERRTEPDLRRWLDLVALGTVCDVVPLKGVNRALVTQGLKVMAGRANAGLKALADVAGIDEPPGSYHAGFILGPRINAGGRVGKADLGTRLLSTDDAAEATDLAAMLDGLNSERQAIEAGVQAEAIAQVEGDGQGDTAIIVVAGDGWHPGVVGIVASRLKERYDRPALVIAMDGERGTGSGRSVGGVDLGAAVIAARQAGILEKGGGHAMAAGLTVARARLGDLQAFLRQRLGAAVAARPVVPVLSLDGALRIAGANAELADTLAAIGPYGSGNPEPRFAIAKARILRADPVGRDQSHLKLTLGDDGTKRLEAIAFRAVESEMGQALIHHGGAPFHIAGKIRVKVLEAQAAPFLGRQAFVGFDGRQHVGVDAVAENMSAAMGDRHDAFPLVRSSRGSVMRPVTAAAATE